MSKLSKNILIGAGAIFILGATAGGAVMYTLGPKKDPNAISQANNPLFGSDDKPEIPAIPAETSIPAGTISPHDVAIEPYKYMDKDVKVRGLIVDRGNDKYSVVGQDKNKPYGLSLDFSKSSIDKGPLLNTSTDSGGELKTAPPVTVSGKVIQNKNPDGTFSVSLQITAIDK